MSASKGEIIEKSPLKSLYGNNGRENASSNNPGRWTRLLRIGNEGQMTVELCVIMPVAIAIAVIVINAVTFFGYCAEFDRVARNAVRVVVASPQAGQTKGDALRDIKAQLESSINAANISFKVNMSTSSTGLETYAAIMEYRPTLFGLGLKSSIFGVRLPALSHTSSLTVDPYVPGELL